MLTERLVVLFSRSCWHGWLAANLLPLTRCRVLTLTLHSITTVADVPLESAFPKSMFLQRMRHTVHLHTSMARWQQRHGALLSLLCAIWGPAPGAVKQALYSPADLLVNANCPLTCALAVWITACIWSVT
jgi:hypothetical protein